MNSLALALLGLTMGASDPAPASAAGFDWSIWRPIVVQTGGRLKPLDTLAWEFVTRVTGKGSFKPSHFAPISATDVTDWAGLANALTTSDASTPAGRIASRLSHALRKDLASASFDVAADKALVEKNREFLDQKVDEYSRRDGNVLSYSQLKSELGNEDPSFGAKLAEYEAARDRVKKAGDIQATLIREVNEVLGWRDLYDEKVFGAAKLPADLTKAAEGIRASKSPQEIATVNRRLAQTALAGFVKPFAPTGPATVSAKKYDPVELYVTWIMTWQGWDKVNAFEQMGKGRDDEVYWRFHQADAWDDLPMIDARWQGLNAILKPDAADAVSVRTIANNPDFEDLVMAARRRAGRDAELTQDEKKALEAFEAYLNLAQLRLGFSVQLGPKPVSTGSGWEETHDYLPLIGIMVDNDRVKDEGYDPALIKKAREGFLRARQGLLANDAATFNTGSREFADALSAMGQKSPIYPTASMIATEVHYNRAQPFYWTTVLALAATVVLAISLGVHSRAPYAIGFALLLGALGTMVYGMGLRTMISGRAPVTNMYETIIWSSFVAAVLAVTLGIIYKQRVIPMTAAIVVALATLLAHNMPINMGATIDPLQPVLRKNYWLVIHVLTIVASYGAFMLAWALGNVGLGYYLVGKDRPETIKPMALFAYRAMQVGFLLLAAGTILGGWWAADSWGRFWGWDPKETWALIALLGYAVILHARYAGMIKLFGLLAGSVLAFSGVVMAWYGVNFVLGAGLHAYAFGDGGQPYVISVAAANVGYVALTYFVREARRHSPPAVAPAEASADYAREAQTTSI